MLVSGSERFTVDDLIELSDLVAATWTAAADRDWTVRAGVLDWTCLQAADHAVDCVMAPGVFLASRRTDGYPEVGPDVTLGERATPALLAESLLIARRLTVGAVATADDEVRVALFRRPSVLLGDRHDVPPRAAMELALHAHDVCAGLGVPFEPSYAVCFRLREHTRHWPLWTVGWDGLVDTGHPWTDLLRSTGRLRDPA